MRWSSGRSRRALDISLSRPRTLAVVVVSRSTRERPPPRRNAKRTVTTNRNGQRTNFRGWGASGSGSAAPLSAPSARRALFRATTDAFGPPLHPTVPSRFNANAFFFWSSCLGLDVVDAYIGLDVMVFIGVRSKTRLRTIKNDRGRSRTIRNDHGRSRTIAVFLEVGTGRNINFPILGLYRHVSGP